MTARLAVVSYNAHRPFSPRGERTRRLVERLAYDWDVELIAPAPVGRGRGRGRDRISSSRGRRLARSVAESLLIDKFEPWSRGRLRYWNPDVQGAVLIGSPFSPVSEAARRLTRAGIPYVVDSGDPWILGGRPGANRLVGRRRAAAAERRLWQHAAGAVLTTPGQANLLNGAFPDVPMLVRPNGYDPAPLSPVARMRSVVDPLRLAHFGTLNESRLAFHSFLAALQRSGPWTEVIIVQYGSDWRNSLSDLPPGVSAELHPPLLWRDACERAAECDLAVVFGNTNPSQLPSKAVQYLTLPVPRLAVVGSSTGDALADYVGEKPGWLVLASHEPDPGGAITEHLDREWDEPALRPPEEEGWPAVIETLHAFVERCLSRPSAVRPGKKLTHDRVRA